MDPTPLFIFSFFIYFLISNQTKKKCHIRSSSFHAFSFPLFFIKTKKGWRRERNRRTNGSYWCETHLIINLIFFLLAFFSLILKQGTVPFDRSIQQCQWVKKRVGVFDAKKTKLIWWGQLRSEDVGSDVLMYLMQRVLFHQSFGLFREGVIQQQQLYRPPAEH